MLLEPLQTTLAEGVPLDEVTFVVVDLETTGGSPLQHAITEIGAVTMRGGERLGSFGSLVAPGQPIPPAIAHLTGIDDRMVSDAPPIHHVLPTFLEFARGAVFVGHNASFDFGFLQANLARLEYDPLEGPPVCTARLARRVVWPDVPTCASEPWPGTSALGRRRSTVRWRTPKRPRRSSPVSWSSANAWASPRSAICAKPARRADGRTSGRSASPTGCPGSRASICSRGATGTSCTSGRP